MVRGKCIKTLILIEKHRNIKRPDVLVNMIIYGFLEEYLTYFRKWQ